MKVLYIGFSKTGTKTMNCVFKTLGYKCYDYEENLYYLQKEWSNILTNGATPDDFKRMYSNVDAALDCPVFAYWEDILKAFPETKLIVNYRDEDQWLKSFKKQTENIINNKMFKLMAAFSPTCFKFTRVARKANNLIFNGENKIWPWEMAAMCTTNLLKIRYRQHNLYIQMNAPKKQLLVVNYADGWDPICKFLGEPIPDVPFPHANKNSTALDDYVNESEIFSIMKWEMKISVAIIVILFSVAFFSLLRSFD